MICEFHWLNSIAAGTHETSEWWYETDADSGKARIGLHSRVVRTTIYQHQGLECLSNLNVFARGRDALLVAVACEENRFHLPKYRQVHMVNFMSAINQAQNLQISADLDDAFLWKSHTWGRHHCVE